MTGLVLVMLGGLLELCIGVIAHGDGQPSFTDEIPFKITWPGAEFTLVCFPWFRFLSVIRNMTMCFNNNSIYVFQPTSGGLYNEDNFVIMTTVEKEKYKCLLPSLTSGEEVMVAFNHFGS